MTLTPEKRAERERQISYQGHVYATFHANAMRNGNNSDSAFRALADWTRLRDDAYEKQLNAALAEVAALRERLGAVEKVAEQAILVAEECGCGNHITDHRAALGGTR